MTKRPCLAIREYIASKRICHSNTAHVKLPNKWIDLDAIESYSTIVAHKFFLQALIIMMLFIITDYFFYSDKPLCDTRISYFQYFPGRSTAGLYHLKLCFIFSSQLKYSMDD